MALDADGTTYGFFLVIRKSDGIALANKHDSSIPIFVSDSKFVVECLGAATINEATWLSVRGSGFASEADAEKAGEALKSALGLAAFQMRFGIDVGRGERISGAGRVVRDRAKVHGYRILDGVHGLQVFHENAATNMLWSNPMQVEVGKKGFADAVAAGVEALEVASVGALLAVEVYNGAHFEASLRARFLQWTTCVECLAEERLEANDVLAAVDALIATARSQPVPDAVKDSLISRLGRLKKESISRACQRTVRDAIGDEPADRFKHAYDMRSKMVHGGATFTREEIHRQRLDELVFDLISTQLGLR